jgi:hypothetical protein
MSTWRGTIAGNARTLSWVPILSAGIRKCRHSYSNVRNLYRCGPVLHDSPVMPGTMLKRLSFRCFHEFSWPRQSGEGEYYQVCLRCGARYAYDWSAMRRTTRLKSDSEPIRTTTILARGHSWRPRERRFKLEVPVLYRLEGSSNWLNGRTVNISRSGLLVRVGEPIEPRVKLEFIVDMPEEVVGYHERRVLCRGTAARTVSAAAPGELLVAFAIAEYELLHENAIGA